MSEDLMLWIKNNKVSTSIENEEQAYINQKKEGNRHENN